MAKVSVIMPCFNHAEFLAESVNSVIGQGYGKLELIITDDCSSDNSWAVMNQLAGKDSRIKLIRHERNWGLPKSRNDGLRLATGEFIAFCDSDDVWESDKIETQVKLIEDHPDHDIVYSETLIIDGKGSLTGQRFSELYPLPKNPSGWLFEELARHNFINVQSALMRKECLKAMDHFDEDLRVLEDWWYWVQMSRTHQFLYEPRPLARYRVHSQSMNAMRQRSFPVTRLKIFCRMLRRYTDLPRRLKADILYAMGVDLCRLGKRRMGRRVLWSVVRYSLAEARSCRRLCKAAVRLAISTTPLRIEAGG